MATRLGIITTKTTGGLRRYLGRKLLASMAGQGGTIESALVDLSGTLHVEDQAIPGSQEALNRLRSSGVKVKFVTNTTKEPLRTLHERLVTLGFDVARRDVFTSLTAARRLIEERNLRPLLYLEPSAKEDFSGIDESDPDSVVIGLAPDCFNYTPMNKAFQLLLKGAPLIAIHKARYFKKKDGLYLGPGAFVTGLEFATDTKAEVVGKPERNFFLSALSELDGEPSTSVMIGDDVRDDVGGAMAAGLKGILVQTGKYRPGDEGKLEVPPTSVCPDFAGAVDFILKDNDKTQADT